MTDEELDIAEVYLCNRNWSHRRIQEEILGLPAPVRGGGFDAMDILHRYGIYGRHKGILKGKVFDRERFTVSRDMTAYLRDS